MADLAVLQCDFPIEKASTWCLYDGVSRLRESIKLEVVRAESSRPRETAVLTTSLAARSLLHKFCHPRTVSLELYTAVEDQ